MFGQRTRSARPRKSLECQHARWEAHRTRSRWLAPSQSRAPLPKTQAHIFLLVSDRLEGLAWLSLAHSRPQICPPANTVLTMLAWEHCPNNAVLRILSWQCCPDNTVLDSHRLIGLRSFFFSIFGPFETWKCSKNGTKLSWSWFACFFDERLPNLEFADLKVKFFILPTLYSSKYWSYEKNVSIWNVANFIS